MAPRILSRQEHGVAKVSAGRRVREHRGEEGALRLLQAAFVLLREARFGGQRLGAGHEAREPFRCDAAQLVHPHEARAVVGQGVVGGEGAGGHGRSLPKRRRRLDIGCPGR